MAKIVKNPKGFKIIAMSPLEAVGLCNFGLKCDSCGKSLVDNENVCYIAVLDSLYCPTCMKHFVYTRTLSSTDKMVQLNKFTTVLKKLNV